MASLIIAAHLEISTNHKPNCLSRQQLGPVLHLVGFYGIKVGKYISPVDPMGCPSVSFVDIIRRTMQPPVPRLSLNKAFETSI